MTGKFWLSSRAILIRVEYEKFVGVVAHVP
jgi:hypothetical protein